MARALFMLVTLVLVPLPNQPAKDPVAADVEALQGSWKVVAIEVNGGKFGGLLPANKWSFVKNRFIMGKGDGEIYKINPTKDPKHMDIGEGADAWVAIYKIESDTLHLCWGPFGERERPTDFTMKDRAGFRHLILKRDK